MGGERLRRHAVPIGVLNAVDVDRQPGGGVVARKLSRLAEAKLIKERLASVGAPSISKAHPAHHDFPILGNFNDRQLTNSFSSPDHGLAVADYIRPAGKSVELFSLLAFTVAGLNMPYVSVTLRGLGILMVGGPSAVELESIDFDQRFTVRAKDRRSAMMLLDPRIMQLLLDCADVNFDMVGDKALAYVNRAAEAAHKPSEPIEFEMLFRFVDGFVARVPDLLRSEYGSTA